MGKAKLRKHLCKGINKEVHFSSRINTLVQVAIKLYHSYLKSTKQFVSESFVWVFCCCCCYVWFWKLHPFTKPLESRQNIRSYSGLKLKYNWLDIWEHSEGKVHLSTAPEVAKWNPLKILENMMLLTHILFAFESGSKCFAQMEKKKNVGKTLKVKELVLCWR
jgi:hypothetical protein